MPSSVDQLSSYLKLCGLQTPAKARALQAHEHIALVQGTVRDETGRGLSGVTVRVQSDEGLGIPEHGQVNSRPRGLFAMRTLGGRQISLIFEKTGYLSAQRRVTVPDDGSLSIPDVLLVPRSKVSAPVAASSPQWQMVAGETSADKRGGRTPRLLIPPNTQIKSPSAPLTGQLSLRITEFTSTGRGVQAMPADLPPSSGFTYAADFSFDEASSVSFSNPVPVYLDSFIDKLPVGTIIPSGYLDPATKTWVPSENGRVISVFLEKNQVAIDADGDDKADSDSVLLGFGIDPSEKAQLKPMLAKAARVSPADIKAGLKGGKQKFWRIPIKHFSTYDFNLAYALFCGSSGLCEVPPQLANAVAKRLDNSGCARTEGGSIIVCANQTLGEQIPVLGTPYFLSYFSDRVPGRTAERSVPITLRKAAPLPAELRAVHLEATTAGQTSRQSWTNPNIPTSTNYTWNGLDSLGREVQGLQETVVRVGYEYDAKYNVSKEAKEAIFGQIGPDVSAQTSGNLVDAEGGPTITLWREWRTLLGAFDARSLGFGGWTLSAHHTLDPKHNVLYRGDGTTLEAGVLGATINGLPGVSYAAPSAGVASMPDGSVVFGMRGNSGDPDSLKIVDAEGKIAPWPGSAPLPFKRVEQVVAAPDGSVLVSGRTNSSSSDWRIYRASLEGGFSLLAGACAPGATCDSQGDGGPALQATFGELTSLAAGPDGKVYIRDLSRIRVIGNDGKISTLAGDGSDTKTLPSGGGSMPVSQVKIGKTGAIAVDSHGRVYFVSSVAAAAFRVDPDGQVWHIAGANGGGPSSPTPENLAATETPLYEMQFVGVDNSEHVFLASNTRVWVIDPQGKIQSIAGQPGIGESKGDGGLARASSLNDVRSLSVNQGGVISVIEGVDFKIRQIKPLSPALQNGQLVVPSTDGSELYFFDSTGRHLRTEDAATGLALRTFGYGSQGLLISVKDVDGRELKVARPGNIQITGPDPGLSTELVLDGKGWLAEAKYPETLSVKAVHQESGLLDSLADPQGNLHKFTYDPVGKLKTDTQPASVGGSKTLSVSSGDGSWQVDVTTAEGRITSYKTAIDDLGNVTRTSTGWDGLSTISEDSADGSFKVSSPDGTTIAGTKGADARFGMAVPLPAKRTITMGAALNAPAMTVEVRSEVTDPGTNPLVPKAWKVDTLINPVNGQATPENTWTSEISGPLTQRTVKLSTPLVTSAGQHRSLSWVLDARGRPHTLQAPEVADTTFTFDDATGRLQTITQGARTLALGYDASTGYLTSMQAPATQGTTLTVDKAGRTTQVDFSPISSSLKLDVDKNANVTGLTLLDQPGKPKHGFSYDGVDQSTGYDAPAIGVSTFSSTTKYSKDGLFDLATTPSNATIDATYDGKGRLSTLSLGSLMLATDYHPGGQLKKLTSTSGENLEFSFKGALLSSVVSTGPQALHQVSWGFDAQLRPTSEQVDSKSEVVYNLENDHSLTSIKVNDFNGTALASASTLSFDLSPASGRKTGSHLGTNPSLDESFSYDPTYGELTSFATSKASGAGNETLYGAAFVERDALGRVSLRTEETQGETLRKQYLYDAAGRLTNANDCYVFVSSGCAINAPASSSYGYDKNGNRTSRTDPTKSPSSVTYTYDAQDRLSSISDGTSFTYTPEGRLLTRIKGGQTTTYAYNLAGDLLSVTPPAGPVISYTYDGLGRRVSRSVGGSLVSRWVYLDQLRPAAEFDGSGTLVARYVYGTRGNVPELMVRADGVYRFVVDERGSVRLVVKSDGTVAHRRDYDAWGEVVKEVGTAQHPFGYAGGLYDGATGLVRFGARDYDPSLGRWLAKDPIGFGGGGNLYAYGYQDPVQWIDIDGRAPVWVPVIVGAAIVVGFGISAPSDTGSAPSDILSMASYLPYLRIPSLAFFATPATVLRPAGVATRHGGQLMASRGAGSCAEIARTVAKKEGLPTGTLVESGPGIFNPIPGKSVGHYATRLRDGRIVDRTILDNIAQYNDKTIPVEFLKYSSFDTFEPEVYRRLIAYLARVAP